MSSAAVLSQRHWLRRHAALSARVTAALGTIQPSSVVIAKNTPPALLCRRRDAASSLCVTTRDDQLQILFLTQKALRSTAMSNIG